jgi:lipoprotein-anchoring transpeptidase ErfK/SrfK
MARQIRVNLKAKKVRVYQDGKVVNEYSAIVTGPATEAHLPGKKFHIVKSRGLTPKGLINFVQIFGNFGFHSDHWKHDKDHNKLTKIPGAQSHGCIRIPHEDSKRFYDSVTDGDTVEVFRDSWTAEGD